MIGDAETYLNAHFKTDYYNAVLESGKLEKELAHEKYQPRFPQLKKEHAQTLSKLTDPQEIKDEKYVHKNRLFDAKMQLAKDLQAVKDRRHAAFDYKYHLIDLLRMSKFTFGESMAQKWENYKYTFNRRDFFLQNGLYLAIIVDLHRPLYHHPHRQGYPAADGEQRAEHPSAGFSQNVPGPWAWPA